MNISQLSFQIVIVKNMDNDGVERNKNVGENWVVVGWVVNLE